MKTIGRYPFCCTFPILHRRRLRDGGSDGGRYPPPRPVEPGLSSPRLRRPPPKRRGRTGQRPSGRPANDCYHTKDGAPRRCAAATVASSGTGSGMAQFHPSIGARRRPASAAAGRSTVGNFDGVHRGHAALVAELRTQAAKVGGPAVALTFDPHPRDLLRPDLAVPPSDHARRPHPPSPRSRRRSCARPAHHARSAAPDGEGVLHAGPPGAAGGARRWSRATIFGFGRNREGNIDTLAELCRSAGIPLTVVPPVVIDGGEASSSRVRNCLLMGDVEEAAKVLGRPLPIARNHGRGSTPRPDARLSHGQPRSALQPRARRRRLRRSCPMSDRKCGQERPTWGRTRRSARTPARSRFT